MTGSSEELNMSAMEGIMGLAAQEAQESPGASKGGPSDGQSPSESSAESITPEQQYGSGEESFSSARSSADQWVDDLLDSLPVGRRMTSQDYEGDHKGDHKGDYESSVGGQTSNQAGSSAPAETSAPSGAGQAPMEGGADGQVPDEGKAPPQTPEATAGAEGSKADEADKADGAAAEPSALEKAAERLAEVAEKLQPKEPGQGDGPSEPSQPSESDPEALLAQRAEEVFQFNVPDELLNALAHEDPSVRRQALSQSFAAVSRAAYVRTSMDVLSQVKQALQSLTSSLPQAVETCIQQSKVRSNFQSQFPKIDPQRHGELVKAAAQWVQVQSQEQGRQLDQATYAKEVGTLVYRMLGYDFQNSPEVGTEVPPRSAAGAAVPPASQPASPAAVSPSQSRSPSPPAAPAMIGTGVGPSGPAGPGNAQVAALDSILNLRR